MKTQMTIFLLLLTGAIHGQKYFEATLKHTRTSDYELLKPSFEHQTFDTTGKNGAVYMFTEGAYVMTFFNKAVESVLPMDSINKLTTFSGHSTRSMVSILIDPAGKIWNISFFIPPVDRKILTDEVLYQLYQKISEIKVDMNKIQINFYKTVKDSYGTHTLLLYRWPEKEKKYN